VQLVTQGKLEDSLGPLKEGGISFRMLLKAIELQNPKGRLKTCGRKRFQKMIIRTTQWRSGRRRMWRTMMTVKVISQTKNNL
jgi:hypothetical protein